MNTRITTLLAAAVLSTMGSTAFADNSVAGNVDKTYRLKDGGTVFVFKDGKMAVADKFEVVVFTASQQVAAPSLPRRSRNLCQSFRVF